MIAWTLVERNVSDLIPSQKNPRALSKEQGKQLKESIAKFGLIDRPIINQDNTIIGGHQRVLLCTDKVIQCWMPHRQLTDQEADELTIRMNRNTGSWDYDILANQWEIDQLIEWGFNEKDLFEDPEPKAGKSKYQIVINADSRESLDALEDQVQRHMPECDYKTKIKEAK